MKRDANATAVSRPLRIEALRVAARDGTPPPAPWSTPNALQQHATALERAPDADELLALQEAATAAAVVAEVALPPPRSTPPPRKRVRTWEHDAVVWVRVLRPTPPPTTLPPCLRRLPDGGPMLTHLIEACGAAGWRRQRGWPRTPFFTSGSSDTAANPPRASGSAHRPWRAARCAAPAPCPSPCDAVAAQHAVSHRRLLRRTRRLAGRKRLPKSWRGLAPSADQRGRDARRAFGQRRNGALVRRGAARPGGGSIAPASPT